MGSVYRGLFADGSANHAADHALWKRMVQIEDLCATNLLMNSLSRPPSAGVKETSIDYINSTSGGSGGWECGAPRPHSVARTRERLGLPSSQSQRSLSRAASAASMRRPGSAVVLGHSASQSSTGLSDLSSTGLSDLSNKKATACNHPFRQSGRGALPLGAPTAPSNGLRFGGVKPWVATDAEAMMETQLWLQRSRSPPTATPPARSRPRPASASPAVSLPQDVSMSELFPMPPMFRPRKDFAWS